MQFDYEELMADMLGVSDEEREKLEAVFYEKYELDMDAVYPIVVDLLKHTPKVQAGLSRKTFHAFVSKSAPVMLMRLEVKDE